MKAQRSWLVVARLAVSSSWPGWVKVKWSTNPRVITTAVVPLSKDLFSGCSHTGQVSGVSAQQSRSTQDIVSVSSTSTLIDINKKQSLHVRSVSLLQIKQASWIHQGLVWSGSAWWEIQKIHHPFRTLTCAELRWWGAEWKQIGKAISTFWVGKNDWIKKGYMKQHLTNKWKYWS